MAVTPLAIERFEAQDSDDFLDRYRPTFIDRVLRLSLLYRKYSLEGSCGPNAYFLIPILARVAGTCNLPELMSTLALATALFTSAKVRDSLMIRLQTAKKPHE